MCLCVIKTPWPLHFSEQEAEPGTGEPEAQIFIFSQKVSKIIFEWRSAVLVLMSIQAALVSINCNHLIDLFIDLD